MLKYKPHFLALFTSLLLCSAFPAFAQVTSERVDNPQLSLPQSGVEKSTRTSVPNPEPRVQKASGPRSLRERSLARKLSRETAQDTQRLEAEPCEGFRSVSEIDRTGLIDDRFLDLNNDKRTDLAAIRDNRLTIWLAGVTGALVAPVDYTIEGAVIDGFENNDINGDGIADFAVRYSVNSQKALRVYLNQGDGSVAVTAEVGTNDHTSNFFEDLNGDNRKDLVAIRNDRLTIWLTNSSGGLGTPSDYLVGGINARLYVRRDLNNDGRFDFTIENSQQGKLRITIFRNNGDGTISLLQTLDPIINAPGDGNSFFGQFENAYSGDFDGDGFRDYVFTNYVTKTNLNNGRTQRSYDLTRIYFNNGDGTFTASIFSAPINFSSFIVLEPTFGDVNGDPIADIVVAIFGFSSFSLNLSTFLGTSGRFFQARQFNESFFVGSSSPFATGQPRILLFSTGIGADLSYDPGVRTFSNLAFSHPDGFFRQQRPVLPPRPPTPGPDLNGDGIPDRIQQDFVSTNYVITIEFGNADGTFRQVFTSPVAQFASYKPLEFNGDGIKDLGWLTGQTYNIILSKPDGTYTGPLTFDLGTGIQGFSGVTELEFNGDNKIDLLVRRTTPNVFSILINDCLGGSVSINQPPGITAGAALTRQAGNAGMTATIATVSDTETPAANLTVAATTVPAGIIVSDIQNTNGTITATVSAACGATVGANTVVLTVTDGNGATATASLTVNVTGNAPPTVGSYSSTTVGLGASVTVTPTAPPAAGSALGVTVTSSPGFTGSLSVNAITGAVTITNAGAIGTHTITVRAADTCGNQASASFALIVRQSATTTTLTSSSAALVYGQSVTFTATVSSADGVPAGTVTFIVDGVQQGSPVSLAGGKATLTLNTLSAGTHTIRANYSGAAAFEASSSSVLSQSVAKADVQVKLKTLTTSRLLSVSITAQPVSGVGTPTGTVQILVNNILRDRRTLVDGSVQSVITRPDGRATIVVKYSGDENFNPAQAFITVQ